MAVGPEEVAAAAGEAPHHTPRPLTRHFHFEELDVKDGRGEAGADAEPKGAVNEAIQATAICNEGSQELATVLANQRSRVEANAQTFESLPKVSTADASHLQGIAFNAPCVQEWLSQIETPEEDRTAELLAEGLRERGSAPVHAPRMPGGLEAARLQSLADSLAQLRQEVAQERERLGEWRTEMEAREGQLQEAERKLEAEREEQRRLEQARRDYPPPSWLVKSEGTMNVGVVGNSGVGKSLLINRLRGIRPGAEGWAPVGVSETTMAVSMYAFPNERRVRLWDFPGVGTARFPRETYIARFGLRYLDAVIIVTAGRFTETEIELRTELERHKVPYAMTRTKADIDIWNNREDNGKDEASTLCEIAADVGRQCGGVRPYIVSLRDPKAYDFPQLVADVFPCLSHKQWATTLGGGWDEAWVLPVALSATVGGIQGRWIDNHNMMYYISGLQVHMTEVPTGRAANLMLTDIGGKVWWLDRFFVDPPAVRRAKTTGELRWASADRKNGRRMAWRWMD